MTSSGRWVCRRCAALWKWMCVKNRNKTRTVCGMYCAEYVFSWDIWLRQLESLYRCCDKWLYPQFASFCFSVLLDDSLVSLPLYFCHFHFIVTKKFHSCCVHTRTKMQSLTEAIKGINRSSSNSNSWTMTALQALQTLKLPCTWHTTHCNSSVKLVHRKKVRESKYIISQLKFR